MVEKVRFKDLSTTLKVAVIISYVVGGLWLIFFLIGLISGLIQNL